MRRIGLFGVVGVPRGAALVELCARHAAGAAPDLRFVVVGFTDRDESLHALGNVEITGAYERADILRLIDEARLDLAWMSSTVPETYSFTLSAVLRTALPIVAFDIGAIGSRLRSVPGVTLLPMELARAPEAVVQLLSTLPLARVGRRVHADSYGSLLADYYQMSR